MCVANKKEHDKRVRYNRTRSSIHASTSTQLYKAFSLDSTFVPQETVVKSNLISQYHPVNQGNPLYNWVLGGYNRYEA